MPETLTQQVARLQIEYDALENEGRVRFSPKAMAALQKQVLAEIKQKLGGQELDVEAFRKQKGEIARKLLELKQQRRHEIIAAIAAGNYQVEEAADEFRAMGWSPEEIARDIGRGTGARRPSTAGPNAAAAGPEPVAPAALPAEPTIVVEKIVDPITDGRSEVQKVEYRDGTRDESKPDAVKPTNIEDPFTEERRRTGKPLRRPR